jgi:hypothetical protein
MMVENSKYRWVFMNGDEQYGSRVKMLEDIF